MDILFVVPYPELEPVVQEVYKEYPEKNKVTVKFKVMTVIWFVSTKWRGNMMFLWGVILHLKS